MFLVLWVSAHQAPAPAPAPAQAPALHGSRRAPYCWMERVQAWLCDKWPGGTGSKPPAMAWGSLFAPRVSLRCFGECKNVQSNKKVDWMILARNIHLVYFAKSIVVQCIKYVENYVEKNYICDMIRFIFRNWFFTFRIFRDQNQRILNKHLLGRFLCLQYK